MIRNTTVPIRLKYRWINAARFAVLFAPILERIAVIQVPILVPRIIGIAEEKYIAPETDAACRIPTEALLLWMSAVTSMPSKTPTNGFAQVANISWN